MPTETDEKKETPNPDEALNLLKDISAKINAPPPEKPPESQPSKDPVSEYNARKADIMKKMNWNEDQFSFHEQDKLAAAAPLMKDMALLKVERAHKDFDKLKEPFEKELKRYETEFKRVITPELAEEVFYMIKGREISQGRYKPENPDSQPKGGRTSGTELKTRISQPAYEDRPGMSRDDAGEGGSDSLQLTDREKEYIKIFGPRLSPESYVKMREEKKQGIRAISDRSFKAPEIDTKSAGPADRDLAALWRANGGDLL